MPNPVINKYICVCACVRECARFVSELFVGNFISIAQSAGTVEYTKYISAEG